jgi:ribonuclease HII
MKKLPEEIKYIVGIDEVGRGPLAGPVTLGFAIMAVKNLDFIPGDITDSKLLTPKKREALNGEMGRLKKKGLMNLFTKSQTAVFIDKNGISPAIKSCLAEGFKVIGQEYIKKECHVLLDGGLFAPEDYSQETIIKGDQKEPLIGAASIFAKVYRDKYMKDLDKTFPVYEFGKHKGYGTKLHQKMVREHGFCAEHRKSFCKNIVLQR